jgi:hypothetical protein
MYIYECIRCNYLFESERKRSAPFRSPHEDRRHMVEQMAPQRCNSRFRRVWKAPSLKRRKDGRHKGT